MPEPRYISMKVALPLLGVGVGLLSWLFDSLDDSLMTGRGTLIERLFPSDPREYVPRVVAFGLIVGFALLARHLVIERDVSREASTRQARRLQSLIDTMAEGLIVFDDTGRMVQVNAAGARILGREHAEVEGSYRTGAGWKFLHTDGSRMGLEETPGSRVAATGMPVKDVIVGVERPDGRVAWVNANATPIPGEQGKTGWVLSTFTDVTRLKLIQDELQDERERLERRVVERTREIEGTSRKLALTHEREHLARELHDSVTQTLFSAGLIADALPGLWERDQALARERLLDLRGLTGEALIEMRGLLFDLRPATVEDSELGELLLQLGDSFTDHRGLRVDVEIEGRADVTARLKTTFYRLATEALTNVSNHSEAGRASMILRCDDGAVELEVSDDGCGFDHDEIPAGRLGLSLMSERAEQAGIDLRIDSQPGKGTLVCASWDANGVAPSDEEPDKKKGRRKPFSTAPDWAKA